MARMKLMVILILILTLFCENAFATDYSSKETIRDVQQALNDAGYSCGEADGIIGQKTRTAISSYRADNELNEDAEIDEELLISLGIVSKEEVLEVPKEEVDAKVTLNKQAAYEAVVVAFTNRFATDVFTADGANYDPSKFHLFDDESGFKLVITRKPDYSKNEDGSYHIEHLKMHIADLKDSKFDVSANVKLENEKYIIYGLSGTAPSYSDISLLEEEPDYELFFVVPSSLVPDATKADVAATPRPVPSATAKSSNDKKNSLPEYQAKRAFEYMGNALYPYGFECHWFTKAYQIEQYDDGSWWFVVGVTIKNAYGQKTEATAEGLINNTTQSVEQFKVY